MKEASKVLFPFFQKQNCSDIKSLAGEVMIPVRSGEIDETKGKKLRYVTIPSTTTITAPTIPSSRKQFFIETTFQRQQNLMGIHVMMVTMNSGILTVRGIIGKFVPTTIVKLTSAKGSCFKNMLYETRKVKVITN